MLQLDILVANACVAESKAWDLDLRRNLNDLETIEWTSLSHILSSIRLRFLVLDTGIFFILLF